MKKISLKDFQALTNAEVFHKEKIKDRVIKKVSTDSRTAAENDLFVALKGEKFDAHEFIEDVLTKNVSCVLVNKHWAEANKEKIQGFHSLCVAVPDTTLAFGELARAYRRKFDIPVVAIGGSNGKTTTKEMVTAVLSSTYNVLSTEGNLNNHIGVPQTLFRLTRQHEAAVIELGTNHFGELKYLCEIVEPTHGLITNIGKEHLEFFGDEEGVAREEKELFSYLKKHQGTAFVNCDDRFLMAEMKSLKKSIGYAVEGKADIRARKIQSDKTGRSTFECVWPKREVNMNVLLSVPGTHNITNALAAISVGLKLKVHKKNIIAALKNFSPASKRMEVMTSRDITILNDTYNSNPDSVVAALKTLQLFQTSGKKIVVLGDMRELGDASKREHTNIGAVAAGMKFHTLFTYGPYSKYTAEAYGNGAKHFETKDDLAKELKRNLQSGDVVLVKGSRGMKMEDVVNQLTKNTQQPSTIH